VSPGLQKAGTSNGNEGRPVGMETVQDVKNPHGKGFGKRGKFSDTVGGGGGRKKLARQDNNGGRGEKGKEPQGGGNQGKVGRSVPRKDASKLEKEIWGTGEKWGN